MTNADFFKQYVSNTASSTCHNGIFLDEPRERTFRAWYLPEETGTFKWRVFIDNTVDSTYESGDPTYHDRVGGTWRIVSASIASAEAAGKEGKHPVPVLFDGKPEREILPAESLWSDEFSLTLKEGEVFVFTWTIAGEAIPVTRFPLVTAQEKTENGWESSGEYIPMPNLFGCARNVKKRLVFLGDSITQGCNTPDDTCDHWAGRIGRALGTDYSLWNVGLGAARSKDAAEGQAWVNKILPAADLVNICFGVNDLNWCEEDATLAHLETLIRLFTSHGIEVVVYNIPAFDFDYDTVRKLPHWEQLNRDIPLLCDKYGVTCYDFAAVTNHPEWHGHGKYEPHPTGYGCFMILPDIMEHLEGVYRHVKD